MSGGYDILNARAELYARAIPTRQSIDYVRAHGIDTDATAGFCGVVTVLPILVFDGGFFDFAEEGMEDAVDGVVIEAFDRDGETTIDLVGWTLDRSDRVLSMYRRCPMLGLWTAMSPYTYALGSPLQMHRTPLEWLQADCQGAAVVVPHLAARLLLDLPGQMAAKDTPHASQIDRLMRSVFQRDRIVVPRGARQAA